MSLIFDLNMQLLAKCSSTTVALSTTFAQHRCGAYIFPFDQWPVFVATYCIQHSVETNLREVDKLHELHESNSKLLRFFRGCLFVAAQVSLKVHGF